ncbi:AraC family transcriptional regulator [Flavobacterium akiainvivens]|uniref:AraC family transcriptional regulator n=1 Tax=Flavobacterium akiainvivens TaxID=1202724 RepID=A0A0M8MGE2_9FLAO|nr:helix-turn-helix transcriptional regulator [Flavobacterium akiainvivens]KOS05217.1 AraC family transcriptional regulator [Flavobacterium akiainvivens]SFQ50545.1 transcriptional regulator, AraC family [Flavobacterium akiainvivens]
MAAAPNKYYITEVDTQPDSIYCHHDLMGELLIPPHSHKKAQFLYTEGGIVHVKTPGHSYFLPARHYMWIPPGVEHSIHPSNEGVIMRNLYFPELKNDDVFYANEGIYPATDLVFNLLLHTKDWNGNLQKGSNPYIIAHAFKILLAETAGKSLELALPMAHDKRLIKIVGYLQANLHKTLLFNDVAAKFGFSTRTLHRLFIKDLNMSFIKYFTICRMLRAIELLLQKEMPIGEIAAAVGYSSVPTFSNTFYKILGMRPTEYSAGKDIL